jgi:hypothetical protein
VTAARVLDSGFVGAWRSLVAHQSGGLVVVGSNPAAPTNSPHKTAFRGAECADLGAIAVFGVGYVVIAVVAAGRASAGWRFTRDRGE